MLPRSILIPLLALAGALRADTVQLADPFTLAGAANETNLNANIPARQSGVLAGGSYTELTTSPAGYTNDALIEKNSAAFGGSEALLLRTFHSSANSQTAVRLSTDFGPQVAGKKWGVSFTGNIQRSAAGITDNWLSLDLGDTAGHVGPNNASTDIGFFVRGNGGWSAWADNSNVGSGAGAALRSPDLYGINFNVTLTIDETVAPVTASAVVEVSGGNTFNLGPWQVTWENAARYIEIRQHNGGNANNAGALCDGRLDDLTVSLDGDPLAPPVITSGPQPQVLWIGDSAALTVVAESVGTLAYAWERDTFPIPGATSPTLLISDAELADGGSYMVTVTNGNGSTSATAAVSVIYPNRWQRAAEPLAVSSKKTPIIFSEIHPHPAARADGKNVEFIDLYNTNPWPEDLTGWRISGEVDFAFPPGTSVPAQGFLVVAAVPADVQTAYGIGGVLGPWAGALSNGGGTLRLRRANDAIALEAVWNDGPDWPAAADGAGHSLILARPSYGEADVRAWCASAAIGGSPGAAEAPPSSPLDHVIINEILAHSLTGEDFIELYNNSPTQVHVGGCTLSDDEALLANFVIPDGTILPPRGHVSFTQTQLGFGLSAEGETVYFTNAEQTRVLDAVRFRGQLADSASGRTPDGEGALRRLASPTPGSTNAAAARGPVVINELYFHPISGDSEDEWLELRNLTGSAVNLAGWRISDGVSFTFPEGASIAADGYVVVAKNPARLLANHPGLAAAVVFGPFSGALADSGDEVVLGAPVTIAGPLTYFAAVDEVDFADKSRNSQWADGGGSSLELADARDLSQPLWLDSDETAKAPWTLVETTGVLDNVHNNPNALADRLDGFLLAAGEALVDELEAIPSGGSNLVTNGGFESGMGAWLVQGTHNRSVIEDSGFAGSKSLHLIATGRGDPSPNRIRTPLDATIATGSTATIRARARWLRGSPDFLLRLQGGGLEATATLTVPTNLGTPGATNSRALANAAPAISDVLHRPALPVADLPFRVFARIADPDGIATATVSYRLDPSATLASAPMNDDGTAGDLLAGDGIFTGTIPAQAAGTLVAFTVVATDNAAAAASFPPDSECLARVGDTLPTGAFGAYTMWLTAAALADWSARVPKTNEPFPMTLLHNESRILYGTGARFAQFFDSTGNTPLNFITGYEINLAPGERLHGEGGVTLDWPVRDPTNQREQLMHWMLEQMDLPTLHRRDVHLIVNGQRRIPTQAGIYHEAYQPGRAHLESNFPNDSDGRLLKTSVWEEFTDTGSRLFGLRNSLLPFTTTGGAYKTARYRWNWRPRATGGVENDFADFFALVTAANVSGDGYVAAVDAVADINQWMRNFAFADLCAYWDTFGNPGNKNAYLYKPTNDRWQIISNDMDVGLGADINTNNPPSSSPLFPSNVDEPVQTMYATPAFIRSYWRAMSESLGTFFSGAGVTARITQRYDGYLAEGVAVTSPLVGSGPHDLSIPAWIDQRVAFIQSQLATVSAAFAVDGPAAFTAPTSPITITGTAPVEVEAITFNGVMLPVTWTTTTAWAASVSLPPGTNPLVIRALDGSGAEVANATLTVTFTGTSAWAALRINEWLADNAALNFDPADGDSEDWLELYNPTSAAVSLDVWTLADSTPTATTFLIPAGYSIPAGGRLLVWADDETEQNTGGGELHVPFKLSKSWETLTLRAPDGTLVDSVTFGQQVENISQGRIPDGGAAIDFLAAASAGTANSAAVTPPKGRVTESGGTVTFTVTTTPGFTYQAQFNDALANPTWTNLGAAMTASGTALDFTDDPGTRPRRFYRAIRMP